MSLRTVSVPGILPSWPNYPLAVRGGGFVFVSGVRGGPTRNTPRSYGQVPGDFRLAEQGYWLIDAREGEATADAWNAHDRMESVLGAAGTRGDQILRQRMWQKDKRFYPVLERVRKRWQPEAAPSSGLGVSAVGGRFGDWYGIECIAVDVEDPSCLGSRSMLTPADHAANPSTSIYSQMVATGPLVFLAGHIPIRTTLPRKPAVQDFSHIPAEGRFLETGRSHPDARDGPIASQTWFIYNEIRNALVSHGMTMSDIVHVRIYLADLRDLATFHRVHMHFFGDTAPAMSIVGFDEVGHKDSLIEIEPTALIPGRLKREDLAWTVSAPWSGPAAVRAGPILFVSGMLGICAGDGLARNANQVPEDAYALVYSLESKSSDRCLPAQVWFAWNQLQEICAAAKVGLDSIAKTVVYLRDESDIEVYERIRSRFLPQANLAFDCAFVSNPGPVENAAIQIDATIVVET